MNIFIDFFDILFVYWTRALFSLLSHVRFDGVALSVPSQHETQINMLMLAAHPSVCIWINLYILDNVFFFIIQIVITFHFSVVILIKYDLLPIIIIAQNDYTIDEPFMKFGWKKRSNQWWVLYFAVHTQSIANAISRAAIIYIFSPCKQ